MERPNLLDGDGGPFGCFQKLGYPKMDGETNGKPIKMDDLGIPLFLETSIS